jgi:hypothetical protein
MSDMGELFRDWKDYNRAIRMEYGRPCVACLKARPNGQAKVLLPSQRCGYGHRDDRPRLTNQQRLDAAKKHGAPEFQRVRR